MPRPKAPEKMKAVTIRLPESLWPELERRARRKERSVTRYVQEAIVAALTRPVDRPNPTTTGRHPPYAGPVEPRLKGGPRV